MSTVQYLYRQEPPADPIKAKLAAAMIRDHFNVNAQRVFSCLAARGQLTLAELNEALGTSTALRRRALAKTASRAPPGEEPLDAEGVSGLILLLTVQRCVTCSYVSPPVVFGGVQRRARRPSEGYVVYEARLIGALQMLRYPRYMLHIRDTVGIVAEVIIKVLMRDKVLSFDTIVEKAYAELSEEHHDRKGGVNVEDVLIDLIEEHYVERSPPFREPREDSNGMPMRSNGLDADADGISGLVNDDDFDVEPTAGTSGGGGEMSFVMGGSCAWKAQGRGGSMMGSIAQAQKQAVEREQARVRQIESQERFLLPANIKLRRDRDSFVAAQQRQPRKVRSLVLDDDDDDFDGDEANGYGDYGAHASNGNIGDKRKRGDNAESDDDDVLWRLNFEEFDRRFRHQLVVQLVREKIDPPVGELVSVFLEQTRPHETSVKQERSIPLSVTEIQDAIEARQTDPSSSSGAGPGICICSEETETLLDRLESDNSELVSKVAEGPGGYTYCVNLKRALDLSRIKHVEGVVKERFGVEGCRIFRLLTIKRQLEQKQISEMCMLPIRLTMELLYKLFKAQYVTLQEVPRSVDHAPSRTFYLWRVDTSSVIERVSQDFIKVALDISYCLTCEQEKHKRLSLKAGRQWQQQYPHEQLQPGETDASGSDRGVDARANGHANGNAAGNDDDELSQTWRKIERLEVSLMKVDDLILLFHDV